MVAPERPELYAYVLFRMGLSSFATGANAQGLAYVQQAVDEYGGNLHGDLAGAFLTSYQTDGELSLACAAVEAFIADNLESAPGFLGIRLRQSHVQPRRRLPVLDDPSRPRSR